MMKVNVTFKGLDEEAKQAATETPEFKEEVDTYVARGMEKYGRSLEEIDVCIDGEDVELTYHTSKVPFERIRRITGYLVGSLNKWNNAKLAEEKDRVKHDI